MDRCPDCDSPAVFGGGNGVCGHCHGTGTEPDPMPFIAGLATFGLAHIELDECSNCGGSKQCPTCDGIGEVEQETSYSAPSSSGGGGGVPAENPAAEIPSLLLSFMWSLLAPIMPIIYFFLLLCLFFCLLDVGLIKVDRIINKIYPTYKTREEEFLDYKQEWKKWYDFAQGSEKWLLASETTLVMPKGKIIFASQVNGSRRISLMNLQNKRQIGLTKRFAGEITAYVVSPDGEEIAFVAAREGRNSEIYRTDSNGRIVQLTKTTDGYKYKDLAWLSPSVILTTRQIHPYMKTIWQVELSSAPKTPAIVALRIPTLQEFNDKWVKEASGAGQKTFYNCENPSVSPDGTKLAYIKTEYNSFGYMENVIKGTGKVVVRNLQNNRESIYSGMNAIRLTPQAWSPDGNKIAFSAIDRDGKNRIGILEGRKVTWLRVVGQNPAWSPDGKWIAFDNEGEIYIFEIATSEIKRVHNRPNYIHGSDIRIIIGNVSKVIRGENPLWIQ